MALTTPKLLLSFPELTDAADLPHWVQVLATQLDGLVMGYDIGLISARPAAGREGFFYYATDEAVGYIDDGVTWDIVGHNKNSWDQLPGAYAFSAADAPTFVMTTPSDLRDFVGPGTRIRIQQSTTKYFIVTAITNNTITMYGGTDYTLINATISSVDFSNAKSPGGFPLSPTKWTQTLNPGGVYTQDVSGEGAGSLWHNLGSLSLSIPIGSWNVRYQCNRASATSSSGGGDAGIFVAIATSPTTPIGETDLITQVQQSTNPALTGFLTTVASVNSEKTLSLTVKTTYYLIASKIQQELTIFVSDPKITAVCAYL